MPGILHGHFKELNKNNPITQSIHNHSTWLGHISGLKAEKMLRGKKHFEYVLRGGEGENDYYLTFVMPDYSIKHQPFSISFKSEGWYFDDGRNVEGPFATATLIEDVLHLIMHCDKNQCIPHKCK